MKFSIHESNIERLRKKITRIRTKCEKYGCEFSYAELGEEFREVTDDLGNTTIERYIVVEAEGTAVVNGWKFAATIDHTEAGNIIRKMIEDVEIPDRYYSCAPACEHCHSLRHRKDTYLVYNVETNEFKQVGSSCLCDFTGGLSAEAAAAYISMFDEMISCEAPSSSGYQTTWFERDVMLMYAVDIVRNIGYASSQYPDGSVNPECTKWEVHTAWGYDHNARLFESEVDHVRSYRAKFHPDYTSKDLLDEVDRIVKYFQSIEDSNEYLHNLKVLANSKYLEFRNLGFLVSMVPTYRRAMDRIAEDNRRKSEHECEVSSSEFCGSVGSRYEVVPESIRAITSWDNDYGTVIRYKIKDVSGNVFMWDCSSCIITERTVTSIKGTVKKHDTFSGVKQTWLTRCRVSYAG